jgi:hypothetical protein
LKGISNFNLGLIININYQQPINNKNFESSKFLCFNIRLDRSDIIFVNFWSISEAEGKISVKNMGYSVKKEAKQTELE